MLTQARVKELFDYNSDTGALIWRVSLSSKPTVGNEAGSWRPDGYRKVRIDTKPYYIHRIIWLWMTGSWPKDGIDHKDLDPSNNKWANLREANATQNTTNRPYQSNNKHGLKGVTLHRQSGLWRARARAYGKVVSSYHKTKEEAASAAEQARSLLHGDFARSF